MFSKTDGDNFVSGIQERDGAKVDRVGPIPFLVKEAKVRLEPKWWQGLTPALGDCGVDESEQDGR